MDLRKPIWLLFLAGIITVIWYSPNLFPQMKLFLTEMRLFWMGLLVGFMGAVVLLKQVLTSETPATTYENPLITYGNLPNNPINPVETPPKPINKGGRPKKTPEKPRKGFCVINANTGIVLTEPRSLMDAQMALGGFKISNPSETFALREVS